MGTTTQVRSIEFLIAFDGVCNFCNFWVNKLLDWDKKGKFKLVSIQELEGTELLTSGEERLSTVILFTPDGKYTKSNAILRIVRILGFPFNLLTIGYIFPRVFRNWLYDLVAKNRYRWFGIRQQCRVATPEERARFLDSSLLASFAAETSKHK